MDSYIGDNNNIAQDIKKIYIGNNNIANTIKEIYIGDNNNKAQLFYSKYNTPIEIPTLTEPDTTHTRADSVYSQTNIYANSSRAIHLAFDKKGPTVSNWWCSKDTAFPHYIEYIFDELIVPTSFQFINSYPSSGSGSGYAKDFILGASSEDVSFLEVNNPEYDILLQGTFPKNIEQQEYSIKTNKAYKYFGLIITSNYGSNTSGYGQVGEFNIIGLAEYKGA